jgi:dolichol-phosphate mannosyltransferase
MSRTANGWSLSLVIPAFNEEASISQAIREADDALATLTPDYEVLVVDDGSGDATAAAVAAAARERCHVRLLRHESNQGYGAALRSGFAAARFDLVAFTDADCQFHLADLGSLASLCDQASVSVGYRVKRQDSAKRRFYSWGYNVLIRALLGTRVRDCDCALKVFRRRALANLLPETDGFFVNAEMLSRARQLGYQVAETGVRHRPRVGGSSKVSIVDIPRTLSALLPFWWSRVLFPGRPRRRRTRDLNGLLAFLTLVLVAALLFFSRLRSPLLEPEESRYAEIPRQMLAEGRWLVPILRGEPYYHKPPLLYWLTMASYSTFGVRDWAARLVPCTAGLLTVLLTFFWGKRSLGTRAAFAGALMLCLSARFVYLGRMLTMDGLLSLFVVAGLAAAYAAMSGPRFGKAWWLLSALACGLGVLTKGPVAAVLVVVPLVATFWLDRRNAPCPWSMWALYASAVAAVACPWYVLLALHDPAFAGEFFWTHNFLRYVSPIDHPEPPWFYLPGLFVGMLPWSLLLVPMARFLSRHSGTTAARRPAGLGLVLLSAVWCLIFYSTAGCKRVGYILPAIPPLALGLGCYVNVIISPALLRRTTAAVARRTARIASHASLLVLGAGLLVSVLAVTAGLQKPGQSAVMASTATIGIAAVWLLGRKRRLAPAAGLCAATTFALLLAAIQLVLPGYARKFSLRSQTKPMARLLRHGAVPVACYPHLWDSIPFYLGRDDVRVYSAADRRRLVADLVASPQTAVFVKTERWLDDLIKSLPPGLEFVPQCRPGLVTAGIVRRRPLSDLIHQRDGAFTEAKPASVEDRRAGSEHALLFLTATSSLSR